MKEICWKPYHLLPELPPNRLSSWLLYAGSFMQRLKQSGITAKVQVLSERWEFVEPSERALLNIKERTFALVREVLIDSPEGEWMFARTIVPAKTLTGKGRELANLKNRSLGSVLFKNKTMTRSEFEYSCLQPEMRLYKKINHNALQKNLLWARRSVFHLYDKPLLLSEFFFPNIMGLANVD